MFMNIVLSRFLLCLVARHLETHSSFTLSHRLRLPIGPWLKQESIVHLITLTKTLPNQSLRNSMVVSRQLNKVSYVCSVCDKTIVEQSRDHDGDEAIFCEKRCGWLHHHCAGLTGPFLKLFTKNTNTPFLCIYCMLKSQSDEICSLKATVQELENTMIALQKSIEIPSDSNNSSAAASTVATSLSASRLSSNPAPLQTVTSCNPNQGHNSDPVHRTHPESDRKFNMIIHGVSESKVGTLKLACIQSDFNSVSSIVSGLNSGTHESSL